MEDNGEALVQHDTLTLFLNTDGATPFRSSKTTFHSLRHLCDQVRRKGPLWRNSVFGFESANSFLLEAVKGTKKSVSHLVDNFLFRQKYPIDTCDKATFSDGFTKVTEECTRFALLECGPGQIGSCHSP